MKTNHLRPAAGTLSKTETAATWRNARGHSFVAERLGRIAGDGTTTNDWEIYRVAVVEYEGILEFETRAAIGDADIITADELAEIIG